MRLRPMIISISSTAFRYTCDDSGGMRKEEVMVVQPLEAAARCSIHPDADAVVRYYSDG